MPLTAGTRLGPYEVLGPIGAGGMGEVYKARDTRLDRVVAIKVLPAHVVDDLVLRKRFERESKTIAALNHPHICTLHDIGEAHSTQFLVLEFIEGESLAERLRKGPLPLEQALRYAGEIADALDKAHRQGIVHRDLKPGNVMLTKSGTKLLDFGLAKQAAPVATALGARPTQTASPITAEGTILGTCQYMAPEQLEGHEADARSDIWAFGALLYEMVTGKTAFEGKSYVSLIAAILQRDPEPMSKLQPLSPPLLEHIVHTCLAKDPDERWQSVADIRRELAWTAQSGARLLPVTPGPAVTHRREYMAWGAAAVMTIAAAGAAWFGFSRTATEPAKPTVRFTVVLPDSSSVERFAIVSPDGRQLAFLADAPAGSRQTIWIRPMNGLSEARSLAGTDGAHLPFWSGDGRSIGFFADGKLRWIDLATGVTQTICDAPGGRGAAWNRDNTIVFAPELQVPLFRVAATAGATPVRLTELGTSPKEIGHRLPSFLPDGRHFVLTALDDQGGNSIKIGSLDSPVTTELVIRVGTQAFVSNGFLLFGRDAALFAQPFDNKKLRVTGEATAIVPAVSTDTFGWRAYSVSDAGLLVYRPPLPPPVSQLAWFTRAGVRGKSVAAPGSIRDWSLSPDNRRLALIRNISNRQGERTALELVDLARDIPLPLKSRPDTVNVSWSADSTRLVVNAILGLGTDALYLLPADGTGAEALIPGSPPDSVPQDASPDGAVLFRALDVSRGGSSYHLFTMPMNGSSPPVLFARPGYTRAGRPARFSPDGRWIAYESGESGRDEVWVQPFPTGPRVAVTSNGGSSPYWSGDGSQILYEAQGHVMAAEVRRRTGQAIEIGTARALFALPPGSRAWQPTRDGQRFLIDVVQNAKPAPMPVTVVVNWTAELKK